MCRSPRALAARGVALVSTGGSARALAEAGLPVTEVARDRLSRNARRPGQDAAPGDPWRPPGAARPARPFAALAAHGIGEIDLLVCNLYPFAATVAAGAGREDCIENIDIGGPALIRAAAKNHDFVAVVTDPADYDSVLGEIASMRRHVGRALRRRLARKAYALTAAYDAAISLWFARDEGVTFPETLVGAAARSSSTTRYGENPHQRAAFYRTGEAAPGVATARQLQGKELSYNNYADTDAAYELVAEFAEPAVAIIKHANPCGAAIGGEPARGLGQGAGLRPGQRLRRHRRGQPAARRRDRRGDREDLCRGRHRAGCRTRRRCAVLARKDRRCGCYVAGGLPDPKAESWTTARTRGRLLIQERDRVPAAATDLKVVTKRAPTEAEIADLLFADTVAKHVKSNAIVFARGGATVGIGAGQMSRVDSARIAARKAAEARPMPGLAEPATAARSSRPTRSTRSPTASRQRSRPAPPRRSSPAARAATTKSSPPPTRAASRWCSPASPLPALTAMSTMRASRHAAAGAPRRNESP